TPLCTPLPYTTLFRSQRVLQPLKVLLPREGFLLLFLMLQIDHPDHQLADAALLVQAPESRVVSFPPTGAEQHRPLPAARDGPVRSEEHTSELQSRFDH